TLPDDRRSDRLTALAIPGDNRFSLVSDSNSGNLTRTHTRGTQALLDRVANALPDLLGIVLDPTRLRITLRKLPLALLNHTTTFVHEQGSGAGRSLINRHYKVCHGLSPAALIYNRT